MSDVGRERIALFFSVLVALLVAFVIVSTVLDASATALGLMYMWTPMIAGLVVCYRWKIPLSTIGVRVGRVRWLAASAAVVLPVSLLLITFWIGFPGVTYDPMASPVELDLPSGALGVLAVLGFVGVSIVFAFGEEFGWRGYLLWELAPLGFWKASLVIGAIWGVWHAPVVVMGHNYPSFPLVGAVVMTFACIAFSPLYMYLVIRAESVFAATILHGVFNSTPVLAIGYAVTESDVLTELVVSSVGIAGIVTFSVIAAAIAFVGTPTLTREFAGEQRPGTAG